ncbi:DsbA family protein [Sphingomonas sp. 3-13AW]|uniref:DsbA family protein n=1 Tax=Sphingomonas sp. 3-13AW TaxID=3050450 RepID=UPI003BB52233
MFKKIALIMAASVIAATPVVAQTSASGDPEFDAKFRKVLLAHPEWVAETMQAMQARQQQAQTAELSTKAEKIRPMMKLNPAIGPVIGNKAAKFTVAEFLDYNCHFCKQAHAGVDETAKKRQDVRFVILMRPILGPTSEVLARFALAADLQGKFPQVHDALYSVEGRIDATDEGLKKLASTAGLDFAKAKADMDGPQVKKVLDAQVKIAEDLGVNGTPFFVTPTAAYPGAVPMSVLEQSIK